jgi:hypothetical protein
MTDHSRCEALIWSIDTLRTLVQHPRTAVSRWAARELGDLSPADALQALVARFKENPALPASLFEMLIHNAARSATPHELVFFQNLRADLRGQKLELLGDGALALRGDTDARTRLLDAIAGGMPLPETLMKVLTQTARGDMLEALNTAMHLTKLGEDDRIFFRESFAEHADLGQLSVLLSQMSPEGSALTIVASHAWVEEFCDVGMSARSFATHLDAVKALDARGGWEHSSTAWLSAQKNARGYLNVDAWKKILSTFRSRQWWHCVSECALTWARLALPAGALCSTWTVETEKQLSRLKELNAAHAALAIALALGRLRRAILGHIDIASSPLDRVLDVLCLHGADAVEQLRETLQQRWSHIGDDTLGREALARNITSNHRVVNTAALRCCVALRCLPAIPDDFNKIDEATYNSVLDLLHVDQTALWPWAENALASNDKDRLSNAVYLLKETRSQRASQMLRDAISRAGRAAERMKITLARLSSPESFDDVLTYARTPDSDFVDDVLRIGILSNRVDEIPFAIRVRARMMTEVLQAGEVHLSARCDRCEHVFEIPNGTAIVHTDPDACRLAGWDGVFFCSPRHCPSCEAVDNYTIDRESVVTLGCLGVSGGVRIKSGVVKVDGVEQRRPSAAIEAARAYLAANPDAPQAMIDLAAVLHVTESYEESLRVLGTFFSRWPTIRRSLTNLHVLLSDLYELLSLCQKTDPHVALRATFDDDAMREGVVRVSMLKSIAQLESLLSHATLSSIMIESYDDPTVLHTPLEVMLHRGPSSNAAPRPQPDAPQPEAPRAKIGRNDPCYCGSGVKFKKCHGR